MVFNHTTIENTTYITKRKKRIMKSKGRIGFKPVVSPTNGAKGHRPHSDSSFSYKYASMIWFAC